LFYNNSIIAFFATSKVLVVAPAIIVLFRYHSKTGLTALVVAITVFVSPSFIIVVAETFKELVNGTSSKVIVGVELQLPKSTLQNIVPLYLFDIVDLLHRNSYTIFKPLVRISSLRAQCCWTC
jgi:hypothetical protein